MVDASSSLDGPPRVLEMLRIFLAANSRGEQATLVLETRNKTINISMKNVDTMIGAPVRGTISLPRQKKVNPARARRSKARLEKFLRKKEEEKCQESSTGIPLTRNETLGKGSPLFSPIPQVDGFGEGRAPKNNGTVLVSFTSDYAEKDITSTMDEIFEHTGVSRAKLVSRLRSKPLSNVHNCVVELAIEANPNESIWPEMNEVDADLFKELKIFKQ